MTIETRFDGLFAFGDAEKTRGLVESELRDAASRGKLVSGADACVFGGQWGVTTEAMKREYGDMPSHASS